MISQFKDKYKGYTCVIVGNGPSLDDTPLEELAALYKTFGANKIYASAAHPGFVPDFWTCIDEMMLTDCIPYLMDHPGFNPEKFIPRSIPLPGAHGINPVVDVGFSHDLTHHVYMGGTVTYVNLQIARYMGFTTALLVGVDHRYPNASGGGKPGSKFIAGGDDPDHFKSVSGAYFERGKIYNRPELDAIERYFFPLARKSYKMAGGDIINLTPNTAENVFEKGTFKQWV